MCVYLVRVGTRETEMSKDGASDQAVPNYFYCTEVVQIMVREVSLNCSPKCPEAQDHDLQHSVNTHL